MADKGGVVAGRPDFYMAGNEFVTDLQTLLRKIGRVNAGAQFYSKIDKLFPGADLQIFWKRSQHPRVGFDQNYPRLRRVDVAKIFCQRVTRDLGDCARHFYASWPAPNYDKCHRSLTRG